ncbi:zinc-binding dehydrogenase [Roseivirga pacifica]|uniref:zinc-binding dehydrogenase n=1 Tax=Roseivirga pacifica TaxID=1267423 RepID=UPI0030B918CF
MSGSTRTRIGPHAEYLKSILILKKLFEARELHANIGRTYTLEEIVEAHTYVNSERKKGNVVVKID